MTEYVKTKFFRFLFHVFLLLIVAIMAVAVINESAFTTELRGFSVDQVIIIGAVLAAVYILVDALRTFKNLGSHPTQSDVKIQTPEVILMVLVLCIFGFLMYFLVFKV